MTRCFHLLCGATLVLACTSSRGDVFRSRAGTGESMGGTVSNAGTGGSTFAGVGGAGTTAQAGETTTGIGGDGCSADIYCTGFEAKSDALEATGTGRAELVASPVHSGKSALRVSVAAANDWARLGLPLAGFSHLGVRFWVMLDAAAMDFGVSEVHVLAALHPAPTVAPAGVDKVSIDLEAGYQLKLVETITPDKKHSNSPLTPGEWHCVQLEIAGPAGAEQATFSMDGSSRATTQASPSVVMPGGFRGLYVGIEYSLGPTPLVLYYDDVAVSETAPACD